MIALIEPNTFLVHTTYSCPLECGHCCFNCGPRNLEEVSAGAVMSYLSELRNSTIRKVVFTGGEPFLLGSRLSDMVRTASELGFQTRIVTSAFWAKTLEKAELRLKVLRAAGLNELSISWDDFHESQRGFPMSFDMVRNACRASSSLGVSTGISVVRAEGNTWSADRVREQLGSCKTGVVTESLLNVTGRAATLPKRTFNTDESRYGPCPYILRGPTLKVCGELSACCGVSSELSLLAIDRSPDVKSIASKILEASSNPLFLWLFLRGPYAILKLVNKELGNSSGPENFGGNCEVCSYLLGSDPTRGECASAMALEKKDELRSEALVLKALGIIRLEDDHPLQSFWR